uniref:Uncharacterized protein n=1 Tax=Anguilla anguilla TaxID=7936 RepID=A0A0E9X825_ANGAN
MFSTTYIFKRNFGFCISKQMIIQTLTKGNKVTTECSACVMYPN